MDKATFFRKLLALRNLNPTRLASAIKMPTAQSGFHRLRAGEIQSPTRGEALERAAKHLGVDVLAFFDEDLADREWARVSGEPPPAWDNNTTSAPASYRARTYPVISRVQAGNWSEIMDNFQPGDAEEMVEGLADLGPNGFVLRVDGASMTNPSGGMDNFPEGMYVHVHPGLEPSPGDYVVAKRAAENEATFKKLVQVNGQLYLHAINPAWPTPYIKLEPGDSIVGKVKFAGWKY